LWRLPERRRVLSRTILLLAVMVTGLAVGSGMALSAPASPPHAHADGEFRPQLIGGTPVPNGKYRYIGVVLDKRINGGPFQQWFCGGTLIDRDSVLTAAHCFGKNSNPRNFRVLLGRARLNGGSRGVFRGVERIFRHPDFGFPTRNTHDAAVLKLSHPVPRSIPKIKLAEVTSGDKLERPGSSAVVAGWGATSNSLTYPYRMRTARVPISGDRYAKRYWGSQYVRADMVAAGHGDKGICAGDSGGPIMKVVNRNGKKVHIQIGITSFLTAGTCTAPDAPEVFTEVNSPHIAPFIKSAARK
jgi:secreted trypsin-like serine protease